MMKKITLLLLAFIAFSAKAQVLFLDDMSTDLSASYTFIDGDSSEINPFYTDQGAFTNGSWGLINFGPPIGPGYYSSSSFVGADSCTAAKDYMVLPVLDFTTALASPTITISAAASQGGGAPVIGIISVYATTSIAGTVPVASDFSGAALATYNLTTSVVDYVTDLTSVAGNATVYIAIVSEGAGCSSLLGINKIKVKSVPANDLAVTTYSLITDNIVNGELSLPYSVAACGAGLTNVDVTLTNLGSSPMNDTVFVAYFYDDASGQIVLEDTLLNFITTPLAPGAAYVHTFSQGVDASTFEVTIFSVVALLTSGDGDNSNDQLDHIVVAPNTTDLSVGNYVNSFELDFNDDAALAQTLAMKFQNNATTTKFEIQDFSIYSDAADYLTDGDYVLVHDYFGDQTAYPASNNYAFTSCMTFATGKSYRVSFDYVAFSGDQAPHKLTFGLASAPNSGSIVQTLLSNVNLAATELTNYSGVFTVTTGGNYHFSMRDASALGFIMSMDMLTIEEIVAPSAPSVSSTWNACTNEATLVFNYSSNNTYTVDWGDGSALQTVTASPATHTYVPGTYIATVKATNIAGNASTTNNINAVALPAPTADFSIAQAGTSDVSVDFSIIGAPLSCFTYSWVYGDGTVGSGATSSHTYTASGSYTVVLLVDAPNGQSATISKTVVVEIPTAIETINFVNGINVFPNPATDKLNVAFELNSAQDVVMSLVSIDGKVVSSTTSTNVTNVSTSLNTSNLSTGLYILNVTTNEGKFTRNIMVK